MSRNVLPITLVAVLLAASGAWAAEAESFSATFDSDEALADWASTGDVAVDMEKDRQGGDGGALRVGPGAKAVWKLAEGNRAGTVTMWIYEDASAPEKPKEHAAGPLWGVTQEAHPVLAVGAVYAPYLSGEKTYATTDLDKTANERAWHKVQYLGLRREAGWHKWTFRMDPEKGLTILCDGTDVNASHDRFNWDRTRLQGITGIVVHGGNSAARQTVWVDDVTAELGAAMAARPVWPPPPPEDIRPFVPEKPQEVNPYRRWKNGPDTSPDYFPIAVWLQAPELAPKYKAAGINVYVGLWQGPTEKQLAQLKEAGMPVFCHQNEVGLTSKNNDVIIGWMQPDEPDNAQSAEKTWNNDVEAMNEAWPGISRQDWGTYGPPIPPRKIVADYEEMKKNDPTRPVMLNLGQSVSYDTWGGRGVRSNHPEDYPEYIKGCDIVSFDIYPAVSTDSKTAGRLWMVGKGVARLRKWSEPEQTAWNALEAAKIGNPDAELTPHTVRAEVWMSIIFGSRGIIYFVHQFEPEFNEHALLDDPQLLRGVTEINRQVHDLARVINSPTVVDGATVKTSDETVPIEIMVKRHEGATYVFAVAMRDGETTGTFSVNGLEGDATATVLGEDRTIDVSGGSFTDAFGGHDVHLYRFE